MERQDKAGALLEDLAASAAKDAQRLRNEADEELSRCEELSAETAQDGTEEGMVEECEKEVEKGNIERAVRLYSSYAPFGQPDGDDDGGRVLPGGVDRGKDREEGLKERLMRNLFSLVDNDLHHGEYSRMMNRLSLALMLERDGRSVGEKALVKMKEHMRNPFLSEQIGEVAVLALFIPTKTPYIQNFIEYLVSGVDDLFDEHLQKMHLASLVEALMSATEIEQDVGERVDRALNAVGSELRKWDAGSVGIRLTGLLSKKLEEKSRRLDSELANRLSHRLPSLLSSQRQQWSESSVVPDIVSRSLLHQFGVCSEGDIPERIAPTCQPIITMTVEAISLLGDLSLHTREAVYPHIIAQLDSLLTSMQDELVNWHKHSGHVEHPAAPFATIDLVHWTCQALFICIRSPAREHACLPTSNAPPTAKMEAETSLLCAKACRARLDAHARVVGFLHERIARTCIAASCCFDWSSPRPYREGSSPSPRFLRRELLHSAKVLKRFCSKNGAAALMSRLLELSFSGMMGAYKSLRPSFARRPVFAADACHLMITALGFLRGVGGEAQLHVLPEPSKRLRNWVGEFALRAGTMACTPGELARLLREGNGQGEQGGEEEAIRAAIAELEGELDTDWVDLEGALRGRHEEIMDRLARRAFAAREGALQWAKERAELQEWDVSPLSEEDSATRQAISEMLGASGDARSTQQSW